MSRSDGAHGDDRLHDFLIAQLNIAHLRAPLDSPLVADFVAALAPVNAHADTAPGFVWRLQHQDGDATPIRAFDDEMVVINMSVWTSIEALTDFVYQSTHRQVLAHRREWFERLTDAHLVLWWIPRTDRPSVDEGRVRLERLRSLGPSAEAFTFRHAFPPPGTAPETLLEKSTDTEATA